MYNDLRDEINASGFMESEQPSEPEYVAPYRERRFLGMTAAQRFVIAMMLFIIACLLSTFCLLVTEKIVPPFI